MTEEELLRAIRRGQRMAEFLKDETIQELFAQLKQDAINDIDNATTDEARRDVWAKIKAMKELGSWFASVVEMGEAAAKLREREPRRAAEDRGTGQG